jgi:hypothetical protein
MFFIDLAISFDRVGLFSKKVKDYCKLSPIKVLLILFALTIASSVQLFMAYKEIDFMTLVISKQTFVREYFLANTVFSGSRFGLIYSNTLIIVIRGVQMILEVILNVTISFFFKQYFAGRHALLGIGPTRPTGNSVTVGLQAKSVAEKKS